MDRIDLGRNNNLGYVDRDSDLDYIGNFRKMAVYTTHYDEKDFQVDLVNHNIRRWGRSKIVASLNLAADDCYFPFAYHVEISKVDNKFQGFNIMPGFYRYILRKMPGMVIQAGTAQSPGGRNIWRNLAQYNDIVMYAKTWRGKHYEVDPDECENEVTLNGRNIYDLEDKEYFLFATAA